MPHPRGEADDEVDDCGTRGWPDAHLDGVRRELHVGRGRGNQDGRLDRYRRHTERVSNV